MATGQENLSLRPATLADLDAVYSLIVQRNTADFGESLLTKAHLKRQWCDPDFSLFKQSQLAISSDNQVIGYAAIRPSSPNKYFTQLFIHKNLNDINIGKTLLSSLEKGLPTPVSLMTQVSGNNQQNQQIFETLGYSRGLTFLMMEIEMKAPPPAAKWVEGIEVRPFRPNQDEQATYETDEEASLDKGYANPMSFTEWSQRMSLHTERFDPTLWFLACHAKAVVGVSLNFYLLESNCGLIDHLGVRRKWRGRGIGLALLQHSFAAFFASGITKIKLNVDSGSLTNAPRLYEKAGMETVQSYHIYSKTIT
jgi:N-acetylglutamate synthase-like GNAT family acetyltransferase